MVSEEGAPEVGEGGWRAVMAREYPSSDEVRSPSDFSSAAPDGHQRDAIGPNDTIRRYPGAIACFIIAGGPDRTHDASGKEVRCAQRTWDSSVGAGG